MKRTPVNRSNTVKSSDPPNRSNKDKSDKDKSDKARAILAGALQVFTTQGYAAASMDRLAAAAGVSKPTLYSYFQDKQGLFIALIEQLTQKNDRLLNLQDAERLPASPDDFLYHFATSVLEEFSGNQQLLTLMRLIIGESERFPELAQTFVQQIQLPLIETLSHYLASQPQLKLPDPMVAARVFVGSLVHYLIIQNLLHGSEIMPLERDRMLNGLIYLITKTD